MPVSDHERRLLGRILSCIQLFRAGTMDIHGVQSAVEGAYSALDGATPGSVRDTLSDAESKLEYIRFARNEGTQEVEADKVLRELEDTIKTYLE